MRLGPTSGSVSIPTVIPRSTIDTTERQLQRFIPEWKNEFPWRIHERGFAGDGTPAMSGEFFRWLTRTEYRRDDEDLPDTTMRLTRAMRKLRKVAPREHDVMWRVLKGESVSGVRDWLNWRAEKNGHPERYSLKDTMVIIASGADKLAFWY